MMGCMFLGVEIGGTKLQLGVGDAQGRLRVLLRQDVRRAAGAHGILRQIATTAPDLIARHRVRGIGVGFGGPVDLGTGRAVKSHQIAGWDGFPVRQWFARQFRLPVAIENDQNLAAWAEARRGAGRGKRRVFYVTVGTGVGGGLVLDGQIVTGRYGAAEIGHMRVPVGGRVVTIESLTAGLALEQKRTTLARSARYLGLAIANVIALVNPEVVIVGGGVTRAGPRFWRPLRLAVARYVFPPYRQTYRLVPPTLGDAVVVVGAILWAAAGETQCVT